MDQVAPEKTSQEESSCPESPSVFEETPLVFRYPIFWRIIIYFFLVFFSFVGIYVASRSLVNSLPFWGLALLMGLTAIALLPKVEISKTGICASTVFSSSKIEWNDIIHIQSSAIRQRLELTKSDREVVKISTQLSGYPRIIEVIRQKRPDLFGIVIPSLLEEEVYASKYEQKPSTIYGKTTPAPKFSGAKIFRKNVLKRYSSYLIVFPLFLFAAWTAFTEPEYRIVAFFGIIICMVMMILPLLQVHTIKVEPNKLTVETLFEEKEFSARQIKEITMQSVSGQYGRTTHLVNIILLEGKNYPLEGFSAGDEIIYGFLMNWWNTYHNKSL